MDRLQDAIHLYRAAGDVATENANVKLIATVGWSVKSVALRCPLLLVADIDGPLGNARLVPMRTLQE
jgi:hypothetical protein